MSTAGVPDLTIGLIGAGTIAHAHVPAWKALGARVLIYSLKGGHELASQYDLEVVDSLDELLERASFVDIVTPSVTHKDLAMRAIAAGRHVICEKPLTLAAADSQELLDAAAAAGVRIYPAHVVRFFPAYVTAHDAVREGKIGNVAVARYFRTASSPAIQGWYRDEARSGGVIMDLMVHDLDQARWICGEVARVYAVQSPPTVEGIVPTFVSAHVTLTHTNGAISHLRATWGAPGTSFKTSFSIAGDKGVLRFSSTVGTGLEEDLQEPLHVDLLVPSSEPYESPYLTQLREFTQAFQGGAEPRVNALDGAAAVYLAQAARQSMASGKTVDLKSFDPQNVAAA